MHVSAMRAEREERREQYRVGISIHEAERETEKEAERERDMIDRRQPAAGFWSSYRKKRSPETREWSLETGGSAGERQR